MVRHLVTFLVVEVLTIREAHSTKHFRKLKGILA